MIEKIYKIIRKNYAKIPSVKIKLYDVEKALLFLGYNIGYEKWAGLSSSLSVLFLVVLLVISGNIVYSIAVSFILTSIIYFLPEIEKRKKEAEIEGELPIFLKTFGNLMEMGIEFVDSMKIAGKSTEVIRREVDKIIRDIKLGSSVPRSLSDAANRVDSNLIKRAISQLIESYETGRGKEAKVLGNEMLNVQRFKLKEYSSKLSMFSLLFIMISLIAPTFYIIVNIIQPIVSGNAVNINEFLFYLLVLFPSLSFSILIVSKAMLPPNIFSEENENFLPLIIAIPLSIISILDIGVKLKVVIAVVLLAVGFVLEGKEKNYKELEKDMANALLIISSIPSGYDVKEIFKRLGKSKLKLSNEFTQIYRQLKANVGLEDAINSFKKRVKSKLIERVMDVFLYSIKTGGKISERMAEIANDVLLFIDLKRERQAILSIQKYTLMIGVVLLGVISGNTYRMAMQMKEYFNVVILNPEYIIAYIILNAAIVSWFSSALEGNKKIMLLFTALSSISIIIFLYFIV